MYLINLLNLRKHAQLLRALTNKYVRTDLCAIVSDME